MGAGPSFAAQRGNAAPPPPPDNAARAPNGAATSADGSAGDVDDSDAASASSGEATDERLPRPFKYYKTDADLPAPERPATGADCRPS